jgi:hypothetical protein
VAVLEEEEQNNGMKIIEIGYPLTPASAQKSDLLHVDSSHKVSL